MLLKPRRRSIRKAMVVLAATTSIVWASVAPAHDDAMPAVDSPQDPQRMGTTMRGPMTTMPGTQSLMMPRLDSVKGRKLFASKGCVACHSINGVGGHDATALDAHAMPKMMHPFEFAAKMWRMAPAMIAAQEEVFDEQILFTGEELAEIIAFVHDDAEQHEFSEADIPPEIRPLLHHTHSEQGGGAAHVEELGHGEDHEDHDK